MQPMEKASWILEVTPRCSAHEEEKNTQSQDAQPAKEFTPPVKG